MTTDRSVEEVDVLESYRLQAAQLASDVWLLLRAPRGNKVDSEFYNSWLNLTLPFVHRIVQLIDSSPRQVSDGEVVSLPDWGAPLYGQDRLSARTLRGGHLILVDQEAEARLGFAEFRKFSELKIASILYATEYHDDHFAEIQFNRPSSVTRILSKARLFLRRKAVISNRRLALGFKPVSFTASQMARCFTPKIDVLEPSSRPEQFDRYMVFEGGRQLAPVRNTHDSIDRHLDGRYSIWNEQLHFAPTDIGRLFRTPYWLVENSPKNRRLLPYYPVRHAEAELRDKRLDSLFDDDARLAGRGLQPGDRVAVITHALQPGGAERQWVYLALGLKRAGHDVTFVVYRELAEEEAHYAHLLIDADIPIINVDAVRAKPIFAVANEDPILRAICRAKIVDDVRLLCRMTSLLSELRPQALYVQLDEPNVYASVAALIAKVPHIIPSFRNVNPTHMPFSTPWYQDTYKYIARSSRVKFSGNSKANNKDYSDWMGIDADRVTCIANAVDVEMFPKPTAAAVEEARAALKITEGAKVILGVFRLSEEKNPLGFLSTVEQVARHVGNLRVLIAGVGPLAETLANEVEDRGLAETVSLLGRRNDVNTLMALADLLLLTSHHEGMPNVVLEAQLMGLPVVATDVGGTREALGPGSSAFICPPDDIAALASACVQTLTDESLARRMGQDAATFAREAFSVATMTSRYIALAGGARSA